MHETKLLILSALLASSWLLPPARARAAAPATRSEAARKARLEREVTSLLYHFPLAGGDAAARGNFVPAEPFIVGYMHFRKGDEAKAKPLLEQAVREGWFAPQSRYILAYLDWKKFKADGRGDLAGAYAHLESAIAEDPEYASSYYLRGIMSWGHRHEAKPAADDLAKAVKLARGTCLRLHVQEEIDSSWRRPDTQEALPDLARIQNECAAAHGLKDEVKKLRDGRPSQTR